MDLYGLIGRNISYSFSPGYFREKFQKEGIDADYVIFDIDDIRKLPDIISKNPNLRGLNVTIPYKQEVIHFLDELSEDATKIGAVNTIAFRNGKLIGHNTDWIGFRDSIKPMLDESHQKALILGTGGAAQSVAYALDSLNIRYEFVSRSGEFGYEEIGQRAFFESTIIINCTPVGTHPNTEEAVPIPYYLFTEKHIAYDLIYNPEKTLFLQKAEAAGAKIKNGREMLERQAEESWKIWGDLKI